MDKIIFSIGGGELFERTTLDLDKVIVERAQQRAGDKRVNALFIGTASHDCMPYYNTFHKVYTGTLGVKTDVLLCVYTQYDYEKMKGKFDKADLIYIGGGDTMFMIEKWKESGILDLLKDAYDRGVIISGLSAGAICWFEDIYTDSAANGDKYQMEKGIGLLKGIACPHYNERVNDFDETFMRNSFKEALAIENNSMIEFVNGELSKTYSSGGTAYKLVNNNGELIKEKI